MTATEFPKVPYGGTFRFVSDQNYGKIWQRVMKLQIKRWWGWKTVATLHFDLKGHANMTWLGITEVEAAEKCLEKYKKHRTLTDRKVVPA